MDFSIWVANAKMLIICAVTAQLICVFVFAYACYWFGLCVIFQEVLVGEDEAFTTEWDLVVARKKVRSEIFV